MKRRTELVFLGSMMSALWALNAQIATDGDHEPAANAWMKIPTPYTAHDGSVPADLRAVRDQFWDSVFPSHEPLTPETAGATAVGGTLAGGSHEIGQLSSRAVVIATFTNARSILTASGHCVYTEVVLRVNEVFESTNPPIAPSTDITVSFVGGTVTTPSGRPLSFLTQLRALFIRPLRRYLLVLKHHPQGDFFQIAGQWDVSDGIVRADDINQIGLVRQGKSTLNGLTLDRLRKELPLKLKPPHVADDRRTDTNAIYSAVLGHPNEWESRNNEKAHLVEELSDYRYEQEKLEGCIRVPAAYRASFAELLAERAAMQYEQYNLEYSFTASGRYMFITKPQADEFRALPMHRKSPDDVDMFRGAGDLLVLSNVYFDRKRTLAAVFTYRWCGLECAIGRWRVFTVNATGGWEEQSWVLTKIFRNGSGELAKPGTTFIRPRK